MKNSLSVLCVIIALAFYYFQYQIMGHVMLGVSAVCQYGWSSFFDFGAKRSVEKD